MTEMLPLPIGPQPLKLRVEDYLLLDGAGAFAEYKKTELIEGEIVFVNAAYLPHARVQTQLLISLSRALQAIDSSLSVVVEASVAMPDHSVPQPDLIVTAQVEGDRLVDPRLVALVVEVADSSLGQDRGRKAWLYASEGVPEYWIADVNARRLYQFWEPSAAGWGREREWRFGEAVESATIAGLIADTALL